MSAASARPTPKPWPMKWVVAVIVVFIAGYTFVNLRYRKKAAPHQPAKEMHDRMTAARLKEAGWEKIPIDSRRPVEKPSVNDADIKRGAVGFGLDLDNCYVDKPRLLASIDKVAAPAFVARGNDYTFYFTASVTDLKFQLGDVELLRRGNDLVLVPVAESLPGKELYSRWNDANYCVSFPTNGLAPGRYQVRLIANGPAALWTLTVQ